MLFVYPALAATLSLRARPLPGAATQTITPAIAAAIDKALAVSGGVLEGILRRFAG